MGRPNKKIGRVHKNCEKKRQLQGKNPTGRPQKYVQKKQNKVFGFIILSIQATEYLYSRMRPLPIQQTTIETTSLQTETFSPLAEASSPLTETTSSALIPGRSGRIFWSKRDQKEAVMTILYTMKEFCDKKDSSIPSCS